jgi:hypothetical protein
MPVDEPFGSPRLSSGYFPAVGPFHGNLAVAALGSKPLSRHHGERRTRTDGFRPLHPLACSASASELNGIGAVREAWR